MEEIKEDMASDQGPFYHFFGLLSIDLFIEKAPLGKAYQNTVRTVTVATNLHGTDRHPKITGGDLLFQYPANLFTVTRTGFRWRTDRYAGSLVIGSAKVRGLKFHATSLYFILDILVILDTLAGFYSNILAAALATSST